MTMCIAKKHKQQRFLLSAFFIAFVIITIVPLPHNITAQAHQTSDLQMTAEDYFARGVTKILDFKGAIADFTQAIRLNPNLSKAYYYRGLAYSSLGDDSSAVRDFVGSLHSVDEPGVEKDIVTLEVLRLTPHSAEEYYKRGLTRYDLSDIKGALRDINQAVRLNSRFPDAYYSRALIQWDIKSMSQGSQTDDRRRDLRQLKDYTQAIQLNSKFADAYFYRGYSHLQLDKKRAAIQDWSRSIQLNPKDAIAYYWRAQTYYRLGDRRKAVNDYLMFIRNYRDDLFGDNFSIKSVPCIQKRTVCFFLDSKESVEYHTQATQHYSKDVVAYLRRGFAFYRLKS